MNILVVDDDQRQRELLADVFTSKGYTVTATGDGREALLLIESESYDTVVTDLKMPHVDGAAILRTCHQRDQELPVIIITGYGSVDSAIAAMKVGAHDYVQKPFDPEELAFTVGKAVAHFGLVKKNRDLAATLVSLKADDIIGSSTAMQAVKAMVERIASLEVTVLLQGETGTGKELVARLIHRSSKRAAGKFLAINCGALNESLLESELFGHERGAFTGAVQQKKGLFEAAAGGTLFLDEINSMPSPLQVRLLRVLQENRFLRVGGTVELETDVRIISAANADLKEEVAAGRFRDDLFYRLHVMTITLPPLRVRPGDIAELSYHFLNKYSLKYEKNIKEISSAAMRLLCQVSWPGNVRELENVISRAVIMESGAAITPASLPEDLRQSGVDTQAPPMMNLTEMEQFMIKKALRQTGGNRTQAAGLLGIDVSTLWRKMQRYGLQE